ncbi:hypothetical protein EYF80_021303 [Liparis tanakae]|uniref:Uncharacterized protein n=1 Tax=Liparis tanakae TaxID=230148 RepID=A0A4Z2HRZ2_9TELE|nr:hypothetical protein EYF80_021303 [Liparis tanakae]
MWRGNGRRNKRKGRHRHARDWSGVYSTCQIREDKCLRAGETEYTEELGDQRRGIHFFLCKTRRGRPKLGWDESLVGGRRPMTDIDSPAVYSSLIAAKLEDEAAEVGRHLPSPTRSVHTDRDAAGPDGAGRQRPKGGREWEEESV